jgi:hypothetical protein
VSRPTIKQLQDENTWLKAKLATALGFHVPVPLTGEPDEVFVDAILRQGDRFAIVRHRPMGAQAWIDGQWVPINHVPDDAFTFDAIEAHRKADELVAEELDEAIAWGLTFAQREPSGTEEHLAEFAQEVSA